MMHWKSSLRRFGHQYRQYFLVSRGEAVVGSSVWRALCSSSFSSQHYLLKSPNIPAKPKLNHCTGGVLDLNSIQFNPNRKMSSSSIISMDSINPNLIKMEYAVRGPLVIRAGEIEKELAAGKEKPFTKVIRANIGDAHAMGQRPVTHLRQMLALTYDTSLFKESSIPDDVKKRAEIFLNGCQGRSAGSYTDSCGVEIVRRQVADFIKRRDGYDSDWNNIVLSAGASPAIKNILALLNKPSDDKRSGILIPIPQYPLYSATLAEYDMEPIGYYLDESNKWSMDVGELERALEESSKTCQARGIVIINPGNPTGQVLTEENIKQIIEFAKQKSLVLLADEVYQDNIYAADSKFFSFKKILNDMGSDVPLVSFMSVSKGYLGECGIRGGYMELVNFPKDVQATLYKSITASLCPTTAGQVAVSALVNPPKKGEESYDLYKKERTQILGALQAKAKLICDTFNTFDGFLCNPVQGAMYSFPQIIIPPKAVEAAKAKKMEPDVFYAFELLESTGICIVPGSGFKQKPGTYHFRTTILPQPDLLKIMLDKFKSFHDEFMKKYN